MHRLIPFIVVLFLSLRVMAQLPQSAYSFNCKKEISLPCGQNCLTINTTVPAIGSSSNQYTVSKAGCFKPNVSPSAPGNVVFSVDDRYSPVLILPFDFSFYGLLYNQLTVSTNGMVSFDLATANQGAQWTIPGGESTLPSNFYDRAIIMGVYHDVDIQVPGTSPDRRIKYELTGTAPHRKWVLTFYKVPCYQNICWNKINNTYQVTLYEGLGLVEVHVFEREVCLTWNNGNAMIGMQNYNRDNGIMAPGRSAWTTPQWGGLNMNEAWRFAPNDGAPLLKKVELYTPAGQLIAAGDTVNDGNGNYNVSFANVCPVEAVDTYLIKSTYKKIDDVAAEVYGVDTVVVSKPVIFTPSVQVQPACAGMANGGIIITHPVGTAYSYSINAAAFQSTPQFNNLANGMYMLAVRDNVSGCEVSTAVLVNEGYTTSASFSYPGSVYCNGESLTPAPVIAGGTAISFTVNTPGLDINPNTGIISTASSDTGSYTITCRVTTTDSCISPISSTNVRIVDNTGFVWTGNTDNYWENPTNWSCNNLPGNSSNVIIYNGNVIIHSNVTIHKLTIMPGANVTVNPGFNLTILNP